MMIQKYFLPPDVFFRHELACRELRQVHEILDVGGSLGELKKFLPGVSITTADVIPGADVIYNGKKLPFDDQQWDSVVSVDTVEHVPPDQRLSFIQELVRVTRKKVILIAPYASVAHVQYEKELVKKLEKGKQEIPAYLREHRAYGLVTPSLLRQVKKTFLGADIVLVGSVSEDRINFFVHTFEVQNKKLNRFFYYLKFLWNFVGNLRNVVTMHTFKQSSSSFASRVFIVIQKQ